MAYAFNRIDKLLKKNQNENDDDLNRSFSNVQPLRASAALGAPVAASRPKPQRFNRQAAANAAFEAHKGKGKLPGFLGSIRGDLESRKSEIESQSQKFAEEQRRATEAEYKYSPGDIKSAIGGDAGSAKSFKRLQDILRRQSGRDITGPELADPNIPRTEYLTSDAGIKELFSKKRSPSYTPGMAAFDIGVLKSTPDFSSKVGSLVRDQKKLADTARKLYEEKVTGAREFDLKALEEARKAIQGGLGSEEEALTSAQREEALALMNELESIYKHEHPVFKEQLNATISAAADELAKSGLHPDEIQRVLKSIETEYRNNPSVANEYLSRLGLPYGRGHEFNPQEMYTAEEAARFNRIMELLGRGDSRQGRDVESDLGKYIHSNPNMTATFAKDTLVRGVSQLDDEIKRRAAERKWPESSDRKFFPLKKYLKSQEGQDALKRSFDYIKDKTGRNLLQELKDNLYEDYVKLGENNHSKLLRMLHLAKLHFPFLKPYINDTMHGIKNVPDDLFLKAISQGIHRSIDDKHEYLPAINEMFREEFDRKPYSREDLDKISQYHKALGIKDPSYDKIHGKSLLLGNESDPNSFDERLNRFKQMLRAEILKETY